jgi:hypothetical protein
MAADGDRSTPLQALSAAVRPYRFLIAVYCGALLLAAWEVAHRGRRVDLLLDPKHNFAEAVATLYPDDAGVHQLRTSQILLCVSARRERADSTVCRQFDGKNPVQEARRHFEQGIAAGKHIEDLYYGYVQLLRSTGAPQREIDAAYEAWRRNFPLSTRPDPR